MLYQIEGNYKYKQNWEIGIGLRNKMVDVYVAAAFCNVRIARPLRIRFRGVFPMITLPV